MFCISIPEAFLAFQDAETLAYCLYTESAVMLHARDDNLIIYFVKHDQNNLCGGATDAAVAITCSTFP